MSHSPSVRDSFSVDPASPLAAFGWDAEWSATFTSPLDGPLAAAPLEPGRVVAGSRDHLRVVTASGEEEAWVPGRLLYQAESPLELPCTGDWLALRRLGDGDPLLVERVLPRRTLFVRRAAGRAVEPQALAANVELAFLVSSLTGDWSARRLERWLVLAREAGAAPVVVLTKADLCADRAAVVAEAMAVAGGAPVHVVSALAGPSVSTGPPASTDPLVALGGYLAAGRTIALLGSSGVGKSTLANRLAGRELMATAPVAEDGRGRHTTTRRELLRLPSGVLLLDTPGLREVGVWLGEESLEGLFPEIAEAARHCRFRDCTHGEEPGCAVRAAVERGELDAGRLAGQQRLAAELAALRRRTDQTAAREEKRRWKAIHRAQKKHQPRKL